MMTQTEIDEILDKGRSDGAGLYLTARALSTIGVVAIVVVVLGFVAAIFYGMEKAGLSGVAASILILIVLGLGYLAYLLQSLALGTAKVLVNILFAHLAILEGQKR